jgi:hypothetical protein
MARKSIPSSKRENFPSRTLFSKRCGAGGEPQHFRSPISNFPLRNPRCTQRSLTEIISQLRTSNLQDPTAYIELKPGMLVRSSTFDVRCSMFRSDFSGRVMGAWWPPRSSKPSSARFTGRGVFDSLPLRQLNLRFTICDLRALAAPVSARPRVNRRSSIADRKGGDADVA